MRENEREEINFNKKSGRDFLYEIYFGGPGFFREKIFQKRKRRGRGPDRKKRPPQPWAIGEARHARILAMLREGRGQRRIAKELGVGVQTVQRRAAILRREDDEDGMVDFRRVMRKVCERHGAVTVWPCVQCLAEAARDNN